MSEISRVSLFGKLNHSLYKGIEAATVTAKLRGNPYVELVHWIHQLIQLPDSDLSRIIRHFELDPSVLAKDVITALDRLPRGASSISDFSAHVSDSIERGWVYGTLMFGASEVRSGYLMVGITKTAALRSVLSGISKQFDKIKVEALSDNLADLIKDSPENQEKASDGFSAGSPGEASEAIAPAAMGKQEAL